MNFERKQDEISFPSQPKLQPPADFRPWCNYDCRRYTHRGWFAHFFLQTFFPLSYFAIYVLFEFGWTIFEWNNPIWLSTSPSIRNNRNLLHPVCHFRMCIKRVFFLSWKDRASRFIFFKIKIKSINKFTMIIEEFQIWKISNKRY